MIALSRQVVQPFALSGGIGQYFGVIGAEVQSLPAQQSKPPEDFQRHLGVFRVDGLLDGADRFVPQGQQSS